MGPLKEDSNYDVIWCDVDKIHYLVSRPDDVVKIGFKNMEDYFMHLHLIARGTASALAGYNVLGVSELKSIIKENVINHNNWYYNDFLKNISQKDTKNNQN